MSAPCQAPFFQLMNMYDQNRPSCISDSVGTGGGRVDGRGPCACPPLQPDSSGVSSNQRIAIARGTGTRPPPVHSSAPCPYRSRHTPLWISIASTRRKSKPDEVVPYSPR